MATEFQDPLLEQLTLNHLLAPENATEVVEEHERTGQPVRKILLDFGFFTEEELLDQISLIMGSHVIDLARTRIDNDVYKAILPSTARMYNVVPVDGDSNSVTLATSDLITHEALDDLIFLLECDVRFVLAPEADVSAHIREHYGQDNDSVDELFEALGEAGELGSGVDPTAQDISDEQINAAPVVRFVNLVMHQAVKDRASDIHFEPFERDFKIRYRVDGALYEMAPPPKHLALPIISRVKVISGMDIAERRLPQDGRIQLTIAGKHVDFRVSSLPTQFGESVVLRVLDSSAIGFDLESLGMPEDVYTPFLEDIEKPNGIVVVTGPTGSGKTTTLYGALRRRNTMDVKILTAEEPVEYDVDGIVQVNAVEKVGNTFAKILRAFLRQDPDIILVGEIRDQETGQIAIQASLTGHLVFSTLHTNDAAGAITRLVDMGIEPFLIASTLEAVMGTRLVRTICSECKTSYIPEAAMLKSLSLRPEEMGEQPFFYGKGCAVCNHTGYRGRRGIYEYLRINETIRNLITENKPTVVIRDKARELGMRTLREDGVRCILDGYTTPEEVLKYT
ncbi:MAG: type IV pilus assembly protein PilB [Candidatus Omnitrophota bacterium]|jgi:type IV pilus assembly protein PilB